MRFWHSSKDYRDSDEIPGFWEDSRNSDKIPIFRNDSRDSNKILGFQRDSGKIPVIVYEIPLSCLPLGQLFNLPFILNDNVTITLF